MVSNSFLNIKFPGKDEEKISKSKGNAIWIEEFLQTFDPDPLRYYLTAIAPEQARTTFDVDDFVTRNNGELINNFGNFFNRGMSLSHRNFEGKVPEPGELTPEDQEQLQRCKDAVSAVGMLIESFKFKAALGEIMALSRAGNGYYDATKPWKLVKSDDPSDKIGAGAGDLYCAADVAYTDDVDRTVFAPCGAEMCQDVVAC